MLCDKNIINKYLDNELSKEERISIEEHLKKCTVCRDYLEDIKLSISDFKENFIDQAKIPVSVWHNVCDSIEKTKKELFMWRFGALSAVAAVLVVVFGLTISGGSENTAVSEYLNTHMNYLAGNSLIDSTYEEETEDTNLINLYLMDEL